MAQPCPAVKYTGPMDRIDLARYFRVRDLPAVVSIISVFSAFIYFYHAVHVVLVYVPVVQRTVLLSQVIHLSVCDVDVPWVYVLG